MYAAVFSETPLDQLGWTAVHTAIEHTDYARELLGVWGLDCTAAMFTLYEPESHFAYLKLLPVSAYEVVSRRAGSRVYKEFTVVNEGPGSYCLRLHFVSIKPESPGSMRPFVPRT